ncbi:MAG TPA: hypothetical protein VM098_00515 [Phycisphaerae bacterium]|nr:hypothetical protein [Phycisphaerae bacterium]
MPAEKDYSAQPVPAKELAAPVLAFRGADRGTWRGVGRMLADRPVKARHVKQTADGPVFASISYELEFAGGGYYRAAVCVIERVPFAQISEEYDLGEKSMAGCWEVNLTDGWQAEQFETASVTRNGSPDSGQTSSLDSFGPTPTPITSRWAINPDNAWGPRTYFGLLGRDRIQMAGMIPLSKGQWRRYNAIVIQTPDSRQFALRFPIGVCDASWTVESTSGNSPFSTHQHDPALPPTLGRRQWGLMLAPPARSGFDLGKSGRCGSARMLYGCPPLDTYKDYVLDWPDKKAGYPRGFQDAKTIASFRNAVDASPLAGVLKHYCGISHSDADGRLALSLLNTTTLFQQECLGQPRRGRPPPASSPGRAEGPWRCLPFISSLSNVPGRQHPPA